MSAGAVETARAQVVESPEPDILSSIAEPSTGLAVWRRELSPTLVRAADTICGAPVAYTGLIDPFDASDLERLRQDLRVEANIAVEPITEDLTVLARRFARIHDAAPVRVRLETVDDDGCRLFHFDNVASRLVVTYRGPGTQWVSPTFAAAAHTLQDNYAGPINEMRAGEVAVFRGRRSDTVGMTLHRSPPRIDGAPIRLVGVIDDGGQSPSRVEI